MQRHIQRHARVLEVESQMPIAGQAPTSPRPDQIIARFATAKDIQAIHALGMDSTDFAVGAEMPFYAKSELLEWVKDRRENILLVVEKKGLVVGFMFFKCMSHRWALAETMYIHPNHRGLEVANELYKKALSELKVRTVEMVSFIIREDHRAMMRLLKNGFGGEACGQYTWFNLSI
jgi:L-amino acid N-acyltransferase YncA